MANLFENKDRRVIPNWRAFEKTTFIGELDFHAITDFTNPIVGIAGYIENWLAKKTIINASELVSAGIVNAFGKDINVLDAAEFILNNTSKASFSQISLSEKVLDRKVGNILQKNGNDLDIVDKFNDRQTAFIHSKINDIRRSLRIFPNAITYVELARCYSIIGIKEKAATAMKTALHLSGNNRFVLRSAARLFLHNGDIQLAHDILKRNPRTLIDPWLLSAEISVSLIQKRNSKLLKKGIELVNSKNISPFNFTELASSVGTVEMIEGSSKKSRRFFEMALIKPNDNSLAQIEWASHQVGQSNLNTDALAGVSLNYEALTFKHYHNKEFKESLINAKKWFIDMPFSKRPIMFASNLATSILKDPVTAIALCRAGLISHPGDASLINNLAYALALDNRPEEATEWITKIGKDGDIEDATKICLLATRGLIAFRRGKPVEGRRLYYEAFESAAGTKFGGLNWKAILNLAIEEIRVRSEYIEEVMTVVGKIPKDIDQIDIDMIRNDVMQYYQDYKEKIQ